MILAEDAPPDRVYVMVAMELLGSVPSHTDCISAPEPGDNDIPSSGETKMVPEKVASSHKFPLPVVVTVKV